MSIIVLVHFALSSCQAQPDLEKTLGRMNEMSVPYITVEQLKNTPAVILDARSLEEHRISKIQEAIWVGYKEFNIQEAINKLPDKDTTIVVYCSIGVRSERIGEKLQEAGYTDVYNLYGGIFEWKNQGNAVKDNTGKPTENVHAYNRYWGRFLKNANKVYKGN